MDSSKVLSSVAVAPSAAMDLPTASFLTGTDTRQPARVTRIGGWSPGPRIDVGTDETIVVQSCTVWIVGGNGIVAGVGRDCVVAECGTDGGIGGSGAKCVATS